MFRCRWSKRKGKVLLIKDTTKVRSERQPSTSTVRSTSHSVRTRAKANGFMSRYTNSGSTVLFDMNQVREGWHQRRPNEVDLGGFRSTVIPARLGIRNFGARG